MNSTTVFPKFALLLLLLPLSLFSQVHATVYENGESGTTENWDIYGNTPSGASVSVVYDTELQSNVIELIGTSSSNGFRLNNPFGTAKSWGNTTDKVISFDYKMSDNLQFIASIQTSNGLRQIRYINGLSSKSSTNGRYHYIGLGPAANDGQWHSAVRDIQADLASIEPNNYLLSISRFLVRGSGRVDNISTSEFAIFEDAEDNTTLGWSVFDDKPAGASISNVYSNEKISRIIALSGEGRTNGFRFGNKGSAKNQWGYLGDAHISWEMKTAEKYFAYVAVDTTDGFRYLRYSARSSHLGISNSGTVVRLGLGSITSNNTWTKLSRDLNADLQLFEPSNTILSVDGFLFRGTAEIDNIVLGDRSADDNFTAKDAARFLNQATFGANQSDIDHLLSLGSREAWISEQQDTSIVPRSEIRPARVAMDISPSDRYPRYDPWIDNAINGSDQLRQRVAFALSELFVISDRDYEISLAQYELAHYYDMLGEYAFGNYRTLLESVSLHPLMGIYLGMLSNSKGDPATNTRPDENYAREVLQLFSVGLYQLNQDGSVLNDNDGNTCPTYDNEIITNFARVFTGWSFVDASSDWSESDYTHRDKQTTMTHFPVFHDTDAKTLLNLSTEVLSTGCRPISNGTNIPANQADNAAYNDLGRALNNIFYHPNTPPFIAKHFIQRLTTSNPSPEYIYRVAQAFIDNGSGERGDLGAVVAAVLLDDEVIRGTEANPDFGKLKEPLMLQTQLWRAMGVEVGTQDIYARYATQHSAIFDWEFTWGQAYLRSPSVFNFFLPTNPLPNIGETTLLSPESQIYTEGAIALSNRDLHDQLIYRTSDQPSRIKAFRSYYDLTDLYTMATSPAQLVDHLDTLLLSGQMNTQMRSDLTELLQDNQATDELRYEAVRACLFIISVSPAYRVQL